jgi:putative sterol carrier protein
MTDLQLLLRQLSLELRPHFKPGFLQKNPVIFQFKFENEASFFLEVEDEHFNFSAGEIEAPTMTLFLDTHATAFQLLRGSLDGMKAFMSGKYRTDGNIVLSQLLLYLFKVDDPTSIYQVQD